MRCSLLSSILFILPWSTVAAPPYQRRAVTIPGEPVAGSSSRVEGLPDTANQDAASSSGPLGSVQSEPGAPSAQAADTEGTLSPGVVNSPPKSVSPSSGVTSPPPEGMSPSSEFLHPPPEVNPEFVQRIEDVWKERGVAASETIQGWLNDLAAQVQDGWAKGITAIIEVTRKYEQDRDNAIARFEREKKEAETDFQRNRPAGESPYSHRALTDLRTFNTLRALEAAVFHDNLEREARNMWHHQEGMRAWNDYRRLRNMMWIQEMSRRYGLEGKDAGESAHQSPPGSPPDH